MIIMIKLLQCLNAVKLHVELLNFFYFHMSVCIIIHQVFYSRIRMNNTESYCIHIFNK